MKNTYPSLVLYLLSVIFLLQCQKEKPSTVDTTVGELEHPVLLLQKGEESELRNLFATEPIWEEMHFAILRKCNDFFGKPRLKRELTGRRLLSVSRECIRRLFYLSYAYRMTGAERFLERAEAEMLAVAAFSDWNPSHFLDVAEMTIGMAIGYDWLYDNLSESTRQTIRQAIAKKGLEPSFDDRYDSFVWSTNNWNQVCNTGMTFGALAVADIYPELAKRVIDRAKESIKLPMGVYQPDGAYPEGYAYWGYGTTMNVLFLQLMEEAFGTDDGLSDMPGFLQTAEFLQHMLGVSQQCYNWGDCSLGGSLKPAMFWFAKKLNDPSLLWMENNFLQTSNFDQFTWNRLLPALLIWAKDIPLGSISEPSRKVWVGQGANPVALMRTSWSDPQAIYLGFKAGSPEVTHGQMDIGSFIMEADGVRWAGDFGKQDYESLESKGIKVFGRTQDAERWTIFRYNNLAHNTLTIDDAHQRVKGYARIDRYAEDPSFSFAISDISGVYDTQLKRAKRGVGIMDQQYVLVQDEVETLGRATKLRWTMMTTASVSLTDRGAILAKEGKTLSLQVIGPENLQMKTWSTTPTTDYDAPNSGTTLVGFECELPANVFETFQVLLVPEKATGLVRDFTEALADW